VLSGHLGPVVLTTTHLPPNTLEHSSTFTMPATTFNYPQHDPFYPQHDTPFAPAHHHWLVTDGDDIPDISTVLPYLQKICKAVEKPLHREMASEDIGWWVEEGGFAEAINYLITFF
jgi:hypothetical protein